MKHIICTILAAGLLMVFSGLLPSVMHAGDVPRITKEALKQKLCTPEVVLLDVRVGGSWDKSNQKIKCAQRVDPANVAAWAGTLPKNKEVVLYCS